MTARRLAGLALAGLAALLLACAQSATRAEESQQGLPAVPAVSRPASLVLVSVAGLTPDRYLPDAGRAPQMPQMPQLAAMAEAGVAAEAVRSVAPASRSACMRRCEVVPRMMESSTTTIRLPATTCGMTASLESTLCWRFSLVGIIKVRPT